MNRLWHGHNESYLKFESFNLQVYRCLDFGSGGLFEYRVTPDSLSLIQNLTWSKTLDLTLMFTVLNHVTLHIYSFLFLLKDCASLDFMNFSFRYNINYLLDHQTCQHLPTGTRRWKLPRGKVCCLQQTHKLWPSTQDQI